MVIERVLLEETHRERGEVRGRKCVCGQKRRGKRSGEESPVFLGSGRENRAMAGNVIELSKVCKTPQELAPSLRLLTFRTLYPAQGQEHIKHALTELKVNV